MEEHDRVLVTEIPNGKRTYSIATGLVGSGWSRILAPAESLMLLTNINVAGVYRDLQTGSRTDGGGTWEEKNGNSSMGFSEIGMRCFCRSHHYRGLDEPR